MIDAKKEKRREVCRRVYHRAIEDGCYLAARKYLRDALIWRSRTARSQSVTWEYRFCNGKIHAFAYGCSF